MGSYFCWSAISDLFSFVAGFGSFWLVLLVFVGGFGWFCWWFWMVLGGFGSFWVILGGSVF